MAARWLATRKRRSSKLRPAPKAIIKVPSQIQSMKGLICRRTVQVSPFSSSGSPSATNTSRVQPLSMAAWLRPMVCAR
ncbi:hypothetical protein D3C85_1837300 [compost metagenome]